MAKYWADSLATPDSYFQASVVLQFVDAACHTYLQNFCLCVSLNVFLWGNELAYCLTRQLLKLMHLMTKSNND